MVKNMTAEQGRTKEIVLFGLLHGADGNRRIHPHTGSGLSLHAAASLHDAGRADPGEQERRAFRRAVRPSGPFRRAGLHGRRRSFLHLPANVRLPYRIHRGRLGDGQDPRDHGREIVWTDSSGKPFRASGRLSFRHGVCLYHQ